MIGDICIGGPILTFFGVGIGLSIVAIPLSEVLDRIFSERVEAVDAVVHGAILTISVGAALFTILSGNTCSFGGSGNEDDSPTYCQPRC
jgi:hypothetical protein